VLTAYRALPPWKRGLALEQCRLRINSAEEGKEVDHVLWDWLLTDCAASGQRNTVVWMLANTDPPAGSVAWAESAFRYAVLANRHFSDPALIVLDAYETATTPAIRQRLLQDLEDAFPLDRGPEERELAFVRRVRQWYMANRKCIQTNLEYFSRGELGPRIDLDTLKGEPPRPLFRIPE
jgi:hypothetical protein